MSRFLILALAVGLTVLLLAFTLWPGPDKSNNYPHSSDSQFADIGVSAHRLSQKVEIEDGPSVPSPDLAPDLKQGKHFALFVGIKDVLDSLIVSADSTDKEKILGLGLRYCQQQSLSKLGCQAFSDLLARYLDYKLALLELDQQTADIQVATAEIEYQLERIRALQLVHFTAEQVAFLFEQDMAFDQQAIARKRIALDPYLTREQKLDLIDEHLAHLPPQQQAAFAPSMQMRKLDKIKQAFPDQQLRLLEVENEFGYEAAQRLQQTWQKQQAFQLKIEQIATQYHALEETDEKSLKDQQQALLNSQFEGNEVRRAGAVLKSYKR